MDGVVQSLEIIDEVWQRAVELARSARAHGVTFPASDLLVEACARHHEIPIEHRDEHFDALDVIPARDLQRSSLWLGD